MNKQFIERVLLKLKKQDIKKLTEKERGLRIGDINYLIGYADGRGWKLEVKN